MTVQHPDPERIWTVAQAKARLSEILRLAEKEGPQRIAVGDKQFVIVPAAVWDEKTQPRMPLGKWLVENSPRGTNLEIPPRSRESHRKIPFVDYDVE